MKSSDFDKIEDVPYGELSPEVKLGKSEITTPENRDRRNAENIANQRLIHADKPIELEVTDHIAQKKDYAMPLRVYRPDGDGPFPVCIFYHGGGFVYCNLDTHDYICRYIAKHSGFIVVSVEYRLAPEYKFPIGLEDCYDALLWVYRNDQSLGCDISRLVVAGDSAGGNLSTAVCLIAKERKGPKISKQILIYPCTDLANQLSGSTKRYERGYGLEWVSCQAFNKQYIKNDKEMMNSLASPIYAEDITGLPETLFIFAQCDILLDEGLKYAKKLKDAGVPVEYHVYNGMPHGFIGNTYKESFEALDAICASLKKI